MAAISSYSFGCPRCAAGVNDWCVGLRGQFVESHRERRDLARAEKARIAEQTARSTSAGLPGDDRGGQER